MAEIAIPVVALGAMWLISNDKKKKVEKVYKNEKKNEKMKKKK